MTNQQYKITEYTLILLFIVIGGIYLMASSDIISIFLSIELQSYGLYILCSIYRNSESATSGGLTYFLLGALASCFILLSISLLYINSGCTYLDNIYILSNISEIFKEEFNEVHYNNIYNSYYLHFCFIILSVGFLFKVSAAPFHFWSPDVYDAVPTIVTTFITILPKITIFVFILDLVNHTYKNLYLYDYVWTSIFLISSLLSLLIGAILGITQLRIKRLLAYSTISHIGFILLALSIKSRESVQAFLFYLIQYSIANLNAFIILISMGYYLYLYVYKEDNALKDKQSDWKERNNSPIQLISQIKGYFYINPILSLSLAITLFSFAGVPPLIGFFAKLMVLSASIDNGYVFMSIVAILASVISAVYYLAIIKQMFFDKSDYVLKYNTWYPRIALFDRINDKNNYLFNLNLKYTETLTELKKNLNEYSDINNIKSKIVLSGILTTIISILTSIILLFILIPTELLNVITIISTIVYKY